MAYKRVSDFDDDELDRMEDEYFRKGGDDLDTYSDREYGIGYDNYDDREAEDGYDTETESDDFADNGFMVDDMDEDEESQYSDEKDERFDIDF